MKKFILGAMGCAALLAMGACSNNGNCNGNSCNSNDEDQLYTGVLPAADADGIRYVLHLDYDDDHNNMDGDYHLIMTYLQADSLATGGNKDLKSFKSKGDFTVENKDGKKYLKLVEKGNADTMYFMVDNDSTITMVNDQLQASTDSVLNYSLKLIK